MPRPYTPDQLRDLEARILATLRESGPLSCWDLCQRVPGLTEYVALRRLLGPLVRSGRLRSHTQRRELRCRAPYRGWTYREVKAMVYSIPSTED